jgi:Na+-driven multidrug efflux pump
MSNISMSVVSMLYNAQLMKYAGEDGIAAYGTIMYVNFIFISVFIGYSTGIAPVISYHYGANNTSELKNLFKKSLLIISIFSATMFAASELLGGPLSRLYVGYDAYLLEMTVHAFTVYAFSFLFSGVAIFGSAFFTALNDGLTSALISFLRTLLFQSAAVLIMPLIWKLDGIWLSAVAAEFMAVVVTTAFLFKKRKNYKYF